LILASLVFALVPVLLQHWYKDERFATKAKDEQGHHSFALLNKATGQVIKHSVVGERVSFSALKFVYDCLHNRKEGLNLR